MQPTIGLAKGSDSVGKNMDAAEFEAECLRVIRQMKEDGEPVTITDQGRPVAVLSPLLALGDRPPIVGAMRGTVLGYDDPCRPAADPSDWTSDR